mmetsp:Transcript_11797/g.14895  ORF Transcript_11797/g.14895 Transcript_11797/m.14895 type:complete len:381 (+) Transcript_11797:103-1245(+)
MPSFDKISPVVVSSRRFLFFILFSALFALVSINRSMTRAVVLNNKNTDLSVGTAETDKAEVDEDYAFDEVDGVATTDVVDKGSDSKKGGNKQIMESLRRRSKRFEKYRPRKYGMALRMKESQMLDDAPMTTHLHSIITGLEHSGTTITGRLVMNAPCLVGATETGFLLADSPQDIGDVYPWYSWNIDDGKDTDKKKMMYLLSPGAYEKMKAARNFSEMYYILRENSHLFNNLNDKYDDGRECEKPTRVVDKTPRYVRPQYLEHILIKTPGVPVVILKKPFEELRIDLPRQAYDEVFANVDKMMKKYPGRIKMLYYDKFTENPEKVMGEVFEFLGLTWKDEYLKMTGLKKKFSVYPEAAKQIDEWEFVPGGHSPEGATKFH